MAFVPFPLRAMWESNERYYIAIEKEFGLPSRSAKYDGDSVLWKLINGVLWGAFVLVCCRMFFLS
jgi:hypothetical protein